MAALGVFGLCQIHAFVDYLRSKLNPQQFEVLFRSVISLVGFVLLTTGAVLMLTGSSINGDPINGDVVEHVSLLALPLSHASSHRITESLRLEKTFQITKSNPSPAPLFSLTVSLTEGHTFCQS